MRWVTLTAVVLAAWNLVPRVALAAHNPNEIPFKLYRSYAIVVRGSIGGVRNLNFLIDTGSVPSVLDRRIAQKMHLTGTVEKLSVFTKEMRIGANNCSKRTTWHATSGGLARCSARSVICWKSSGYASGRHDWV